ncbi:MAG: ankyrin repeat domain-containing protein [Gammaproteobacteria bacterium]
MLDDKTIGFKEDKDIKTQAFNKNSHDIYIENRGKVLIGVFNIVKNEVFLLPAIQQRVEFITDASGNITSGWYLDNQNQRTTQLPDTELAQHLKSFTEENHIPRRTNDNNGKIISAHLIALEKLKEKSPENFRGFSIIPNRKDEYVWLSLALNGQGKTMALAEQEKVINVIEGWKNHSKCIFKASKQNDFTSIKELIKYNKGSSLNNKGWGAWPIAPLHYAAFHGNVEMIALLITNGAYIHLEDKEKRTPLDIAIEEGREQAIDFLINHGAQIKNPNTHFLKKTPIILHTVKTNNKKLFNILVNCKETNFDIIDETSKKLPLHIACENMDIENIKKFLEKTKETNLLEKHLNYQDYYGNTIFHIIVEKNNKEIMQLLVDFSKDYPLKEILSITNNQGKTALEDARKKRSETESILNYVIRSKDPISNHNPQNTFQYHYTHRTEELFTEGESVHVEDSSHPIVKVQKTQNPDEKKSEKQKNYWFKKTVGSNEEAILEVVSQEFRRLFNPAQPKSRWVTDHKGRYHIHSKEVLEFSTLKQLVEKDASTVKHNFRCNIYKGLGELLILSLFLTELDLKTTNIGIDRWGNLIVIDGGESIGLAHTIPGAKYDPKINYEIEYTEADIQNPIAIKNYLPYNWLDVIEIKSYRNRKEKSDLFFEDILKEKHIIREINRIILKIKVTPPSLIDKLINCYFPKNPNLTQIRLKDFLKNELANQAFIRFNNATKNNAAFIQYLHSEEARQDHEDYIKNLEHFKITGKKQLIDIYPTMREECQKLFEILVKANPKTLPIAQKEPLELKIEVSREEPTSLPDTEKPAELKVNAFQEELTSQTDSKEPSESKVEAFRKETTSPPDSKETLDIPKLTFFSGPLPKEPETKSFVQEPFLPLQNVKNIIETSKKFNWILSILGCVSVGSGIVSLGGIAGSAFIHSSAGIGDAIVKSPGLGGPLSTSDSIAIIAGGLLLIAAVIKLITSYINRPSAYMSLEEQPPQNNGVGITH